MISRLLLFFILVSPSFAETYSGVYGSLSASVVFSGSYTCSIMAASYDRGGSSVQIYGGNDSFQVVALTSVGADGVTLLGRFDVGWNGQYYGLQSPSVSVPFSSAPYGVRVKGYSRSHVNGVDGVWVYRSFDFLPVLNSQTISANALSGSLVTGQSQSGVATGAQGGNLYRASVTSQTGGIVINPSTGAYVVSAGSSVGTVTFNIWADAGNGYALGNTVSGSYTVTASKKVTVTIPANTGSYSIVYVLSQGGVELGRYTQVPGANSKIQQIDVGANGGDCTLTAITQGVKMDGVSLVESVNGVYENPVKTTIKPTSDPSALPAVPSAPPLVSTPQSKTSGVVWSAGDSSAVATSQVNLLTAQVYREGVEKIIAANTADPSAATGLQGNDIDFDSGTAKQGAAVLGVVGRLPQAPTFVTLGKTPLISCTVKVPTSISASQEFVIAFDASKYSAQIDVFRLIFRSAMAFGFFVLYTRTLRDAFA